jgi:hypothetical protein
LFSKEAKEECHKRDLEEEQEGTPHPVNVEATYLHLREN